MARVRLTGGAALLALAIGSQARAQECTSDADCDDGYECDLGPVAAQDCAPAAAGVADAGACDSTPSPRTGECEPREMKCNSDADCVKGLTCEQHVSDSDCAAATPVDGGVAQPVDCDPPDPEPGECVLELVGCKKDSDCEDGLECAPIGMSSSCDEPIAPPCMPGQECTPPEDMLSCTETVNAFCFPPPVACKNDDDCDHGTRCVALPDGAKKDPPPGWEGADALCLPEAFALALEGRVEFEDHEHTASEDSANGVSSSDSKSGTDEDSPAKGKGNDVVENTDDGKDDGCTVSSVGAASSRAWLLFGVAALWLRRRRAGVR